MSPARVLQRSTTQPLAEPQLVLVIANDSESHSGREVSWALRIAVTAQPWKPAPTHVMTRRATCKYDDTRTRSCGSLYLHTRRSVCGLRVCKCNYVRVRLLQVTTMPVLAGYLQFYLQFTCSCILLARSSAMFQAKLFFAEAVLMMKLPKRYATP